MSKTELIPLNTDQSDHDISGSFPRPLLQSDFSMPIAEPTERQRKLRDLLQSEERAQLAQIVAQSMPETAQDRAKRLELESIELHARKEEERRELCETKLREKKIQEDDQIRLETSKLAQIETAAYQLEQIREKQRMKREQEKSERQVYEYLNQQTYYDKVSRESQERKARSEQAGNVRETLAEQMRRKLEKRERMNREETKFVEMVDEHVKSSPQTVYTREDLEQSRRDREAKIFAEKEEDRKKIQEIVERNNKLEQEERYRKIEQANLMKQMIDEQVEDKRQREMFEKDMEKILGQITENQMIIASNNVCEQDMKRAQLMEQVMEERNRQVALKAAKIAERKQAQRVEKNEIENEVEKDFLYLESLKQRKKVQQEQYAQELAKLLEWKQKNRRDDLPGDTSGGDTTKDDTIVSSIREKQKQIHETMKQEYCEKFD